jgi:Putative zinc ribbon domain
MKNKNTCQSCGMPLDSEAIKGTEKDGTKSDLYCKYCYENGVFKDPKMNLNDMKNNVKNQMKKLEIHEHAIQKAINLLPMLSRWKTK